MDLRSDLSTATSRYRAPNGAQSVDFAIDTADGELKDDFQEALLDAHKSLNEDLMATAKTVMRKPPTENAQLREKIRNSAIQFGALVETYRDKESILGGLAQELSTKISAFEAQKKADNSR